jgi:hypothetical protein
MHEPYTVRVQLLRIHEAATATVFAHEAATAAVLAHEAADHPPGRQARTRSATSRRLSGMVIAEQPGAQRVSATHDQASGDNPA